MLIYFNATFPAIKVIVAQINKNNRRENLLEPTKRGIIYNKLSLTQKSPNSKNRQRSIIKNRIVQKDPPGLPGIQLKFIFNLEKIIKKNPIMHIIIKMQIVPGIIIEALAGFGGKQL